MEATIYLIIRIGVAAISLVGSMKGLVQLRQFSLTKFAQAIFFITGLFYTLSFLYPWAPYLNIALALMLGSFFTLVLALILELDKKKNRTLWRVPIIFGLISYSFSQRELEYFYLGMQFPMLLLAFRFKERFHYFFRQQSKICFFSLVAFVGLLYSPALYWAAFGFIIFLSFQIINLLKLKLITRSYETTQN